MSHLNKTHSSVEERLMRGRWRFTFFILLLLGAIESFASEKDEPSLDPALEKRLVITSVYKSRSKDTLRSIAYLLYGHKTWWVKVRAENHHLRTFEPDQVLPEGTQLLYRAPQIGSIYVVQPNDWLIRIVQWKYGATSYWEEIFRKNAQRITRPNLIHPGDQLTLELNGTVRHAGSGQILVEGAKSIPQPAKTPEVDPVQKATEVWRLLSKSFRPVFDASTFILGFFLGTLFFIFFPIALWMNHQKKVFSGPSMKPDRRKLIASEFTEPDPVSHQPLPKKKGDRKGKPHSGAKSKYPEAFKRRPPQSQELDLSLIHRDKGEIERSSGYHSIFEARKRKNLKAG